MNSSTFNSTSRSRLKNDSANPYSHGAPGPHVLQVSADRFGDEFRPIVAPDVRRDATSQKQMGQHLQHVVRLEATTHFQGQALASVFVGDGQPPQRLPRDRPVVDEVPSGNGQESL